MFFSDCSLRKCYTVSAGIHCILNIFTSFFELGGGLVKGEEREVKRDLVGVGRGTRSIVTSAVSSDVSFRIMLPVVWRIFRFIKSIVFFNKLSYLKEDSRCV